MSTSRHHVVIAGGGVAGIETLLALHELAGHRIRITVVSPELEFLYRPVTVAEAFDRGEARTYPLAQILEYTGGAEQVWDSIEGVDPDQHAARTSSGEEIQYDSLVIAAGAKPREPLPGALTFRGRSDVPALGELLDDLVGGEAQSVAVTLPAERMWPLPAYELALMAAGHLREQDADAEVWLVTPEEEPLGLFGPEAGRAIRPMLEARRIRLRTSSQPVLVRDGTLLLAGGDAIAVDRVITLPQLEGPALEGLPRDEHGFIPVDGHGRVEGIDGVYAAGDVTGFPLKQGGLAAQQADAVAEAIVGEIGLPIVPKPFTPVLRGLLMTGGAPLYLRAEPQRLTGVAEVVALPPASREASAAAGQPLWWPPAKIAGRYLAPFLATAQRHPVASAPLADRLGVAGQAVSESESEDALELALLLADCDARWGDYGAALNALDAAQTIQGSLPADYEAKRRKWSAAQRVQ